MIIVIFNKLVLGEMMTTMLLIFIVEQHIRLVQ